MGGQLVVWHSLLADGALQGIPTTEFLEVPRTKLYSTSRIRVLSIPALDECFNNVSVPAYFAFSSDRSSTEYRVTGPPGLFDFPASM